MEIFPTPALAAIMVVPFLFAFLSLQFILFRPLMAYLEARDDVRERALQEARALENQVEERTNDLQHRLEAAHSEAVAVRTAERGKALEVETEIIAAARAKADLQIEAAVAEIHTAAAVAREGLSTTASTLSNEIAAQVLGRELNA